MLPHAARVIAAVLLTYCALDVAGECECREVNIVDPWTDAQVFALFCGNNSGVVISVSEAEPAEKPKVDFWDLDAQARKGTLVGWEYKVGKLESRFVYIIGVRDSR